ncbi:M56 family metallopeptidase [Nocardioides acrostichi]|uniref:M56 family metallopeptidase n=1 Tax=Nocardioides acrostichi TaxID=2784339 RepID=A0A930UX24_9ACTN|nr:M56 family metallopeptidase [Nocardioides acrostichi]MBF4161711.1 M56 family metallopeptidase [Nocardioides acrostichi]
MTPVVLALLAVLLSGAVPPGLARVGVLHRAPRAALVLWQAIALAAVLAALGASLSLVTSALNPGAGLSLHPGPWRSVVATIALAVTALVIGRLLLTAHLVGTRTRTRRRQHRDLVDLLASRADPDTPELGGSDLRIIEHGAPLAYCLPAVRRHRLVLSEAALDLLAPDELEAVLAHERAHLRARHDLVLEAFTVLHQAFPAVVSSSAALEQVRLLVEMLADDDARRRTGAKPLGRALATVAAGPEQLGALAAGGFAVVARVERLRDDRSHRVLAATLYAGAAAVLAVPTVLVALPWLLSLW